MKKSISNYISLVVFIEHSNDSLNIIKIKMIDCSVEIVFNIPSRQNNRLLVFFKLNKKLTKNEKRKVYSI